MPLAPADAGRLTDRLVAALQRRVETGEFAAGSKLPTEGELVAAYRVSRTVIREAISQLRARGLVETRRGIGTFARERPSLAPLTAPPVDEAALADVLALLELRITLEAEAAALAARRRTKAQLARLALLLAAIDDAARDGSDAADADFEFHLTIAEATGNPFFGDILRHLGRAMIPRTRIDSSAIAHADRGDYLRRVNREHAAIYGAIADSDPETARAAMNAHLSNSRERLRRRRAARRTAGP